ncbi:MAG: bacillithiol biosynthesis BshC, partial [Gemmatimonadota bacterium]|nr:bacillithiol biosynthesis BshC [Gemmatimonadota bacterium]
MTLSLRVTPPGGSSFLEDYLAGAPALLPFFSGHPLDLGGYRRKLEEVRGRFADRESRAHAAAALTPATPWARARLERFVQQGGAMVTTGQQAGLFGGPLYTIHKILTAVRLAETLERELETLVIPVFWIASEDHDFAEVNHAYAVDPDGDLVRVGVTARDPRPFPMNRTLFAEDIAAAV